MKSNFYTIYKTTNLINNKIYIGAHKTKNKDDKYMGSGVAISKAFEKYGKENFKKEILHLLNSEEEMYLKEKEIVNEEFIKLNTNYNLKLGGDGGFEHIDCSGENNCMKNSKTAKKVGNALKLKYLYDDEEGVFYNVDDLEPKYYIAYNENTETLEYISEFYN